MRERKSVSEMRSITYSFANGIERAKGVPKHRGKARYTPRPIIDKDKGSNGGLRDSEDNDSVLFSKKGRS